MAAVAVRRRATLGPITAHYAVVWDPWLCQGCRVLESRLRAALVRRAQIALGHRSWRNGEADGGGKKNAPEKRDGAILSRAISLGPGALCVGRDTGGY